MRTNMQPKEEIFDKMVDQMGSIMDSMLEEMKCRNYFRSSGRDSWDPPLNIYELPDRFVVCVDLAGMDRRQIDVRVEDGVLHVRGIRPRPELPDATEEVGVICMEIDSGKFHRKIPLPADIDASAIGATYRNGYVWIFLPRTTD